MLALLGKSLQSVLSVIVSGKGLSLFAVQMQAHKGFINVQERRDGPYQMW